MIAHHFSPSSCFLPSPFNDFCLSECKCKFIDKRPTVCVCNSHKSCTWSSSGKDGLHLNLDNGKYLEMLANSSDSVPVIVRSSSFQTNMLCITVSSEAGLQQDWTVVSEDKAGLEVHGDAGLPLILSSFIPSFSILTHSGGGYPPHLWSVYQLLSAAQARNDWLTFMRLMRGDVSASWSKANQHSAW